MADGHGLCVDLLRGDETVGVRKSDRCRRVAFVQLDPPAKAFRKPARTDCDFRPRRLVFSAVKRCAART